MAKSENAANKTRLNAGWISTECVLLSRHAAGAARCCGMQGANSGRCVPLSAIASASHPLTLQPASRQTGRVNTFGGSAPLVHLADAAACLVARCADHRGQRTGPCGPRLHCRLGHRRQRLSPAAAPMATEEYLSKFIASGKRYHELPDRFRLTVSEEEWRRRWGPAHPRQCS